MQIIQNLIEGENKKSQRFWGGERSVVEGGEHREGEGYGRGT